MSAQGTDFDSGLNKLQVYAVWGSQGVTLMLTVAEAKALFHYLSKSLIETHMAELAAADRAKAEGSKVE